MKTYAIIDNIDIKLDEDQDRIHYLGGRSRAVRGGATTVQVKMRIGGQAQEFFHNLANKSHAQPVDLFKEIYEYMLIREGMES